MPNIELILDADTYHRIRQHLASGDDGFEEAAFIFCHVVEDQHVIRLVASDLSLLPPDAFQSRSAFYLELTDEARASLIKRAHDLGCCLVEFHSHPGQHKVEFSWSDLTGFEEFVPHVRWRLRNRPYLAVVYGSHDFDALAWHGEGISPNATVTILVDGERLSPTGNTLSQIRAEL